MSPSILNLRSIYRN